MKKIFALSLFIFSVATEASEPSQRIVRRKFLKEDPRELLRTARYNAAMAAEEKRERDNGSPPDYFFESTNSGGASAAAAVASHGDDEHDPVSCLMKALLDGTIDSVFDRYFPLKTWRAIEERGERDLTSEQKIGLRVAKKLGPAFFESFVKVTNKDFALMYLESLVSSDESEEE